MAYKDTILNETNPSPDFYWRLEESSNSQGMALQDATNNNRDGELSNNNGVVVGQKSLVGGNGSSFEHTSEGRESTGGTSIKNFSNPGNIAFELWVEFNSVPTSQRNILLLSQPGAHLFFSPGSETIYFYDGSSSTDSGVGITAGESTHFVLQFEYPGLLNKNTDEAGETMYLDLFINNNQVINSKYYSSFAYSDGPFSIGYPYGVQGSILTLGFNGFVDEIAVYPDLLSDNQIDDHYNAAFNSAPSASLTVTN